VRPAQAAVAVEERVHRLDMVCENPPVTTRRVEERLGVSRPTALRLLSRLAEREDVRGHW